MKKIKLMILAMIIYFAAYSQGTIVRYDSTATERYIRIEKAVTVGGVLYTVCVEHFFTPFEQASRENIVSTITWLQAELMVKAAQFVPPTIYKPVPKNVTINTDSLNWFKKIIVKQDWVENKSYIVSDTVEYLNKMYKCLQPHTSQSDWMPTITPALWQMIVFTPPNTLITWQEGLTYQINSFCQYLGKKYKCLQTHTAYVGTGWTPPASPSLWQFISNL